jgi:hypothetical protein
MMDPVTAVGLVASVAQLAGLAKDVILKLYEYGSDVKDAPQQASELRAELSILCDLIEWLKEALKKSPHTVFTPPDSLRNAVDDFSSMLIELQTKLLKDSSGLVGRLIKWPFTKKEMATYLLRLERYKSTFSAALHIETV